MRFIQRNQFVIKLVIIVLSYGYIIYKLTISKDAIAELFHTVSDGVLFFMILLFLLMTANWLVETAKWFLLTKSIEKQRFWSLFAAVLSGVGVSIFTPGRVGQFAGRIIFLKEENRAKGITASISGSVAQWFTTIIMGFLGLLYFAFINELFLHEIWQKNVLVIVVMVLIAVLFFGYLNIRIVDRLVQRVSFLNRFRASVSLLRDYSRRNLLYVLLLSIIRYGIFMVQFYLVFNILGIDIEAFTCFAIVSIMFLGTAILPLTGAVEPGVKGSVLSIMGEMLMIKSTGLLLVPMIVWMINLMIPAIIGNVLFSKTKI
ncbi:MAG: hypothetical protein C0594_02470 [Marinilabiliales bacterium]|nr:MAG: hypothetical protein C0594_02470 [Marinilabiliales bacterium]